MSVVDHPHYLPDGMPSPLITDLDRAFWEAARDGRLVVQACGDCGAAQFPPEEICNKCHSTNRTWREVRGEGRIFSWSRIWHPVHPALQGRGPYIAVVVRLDEEPSILMIGNLLGETNQAVEIGAPVRATYEDHGAYGLIQWQRA